MQKVSFLALAIAICFTATAQAQPPSFVDLGVIGTPGSTFIFNTDNSLFDGGANIDTELGLWDSSGILISSDDDGSAVGLFSEITETLPAGEYFLGISEFNSVFEDGFVNSGTGFEAGEFGTVTLNIDGAFAGSQIAGNPDTGFEQTGFFRVEVSAVPEPTSVLVLFGTAGLALVRRRR